MLNVKIWFQVENEREREWKKQELKKNNTPNVDIIICAIM